MGSPKLQNGNQVKHLLIFLSLLLLSFPLFGQEKGVLYQYKTTSGFIWKTFGKGKVQPKFEGEVLNGFPDGFGVLSYPFADGKSVVGEWKLGKEWNTEHYKKDGKLIGEWVNGKWILKWGVLCKTLKGGITVWYEKCNVGVESKYVGDIKNRIPNGQGTYIFVDGRKYLGGWKDGKKHGQGTFTNPDGYTYTGEWKDGKTNGRGTETFPDRDKYVGKFKNGKKHGQGTHTSPDGDKYVGKFKNGKKHGQGTLTSPNGDEYLGKFKNGKKHGQGTLTSFGGFRYVGKFKNGKKHGLGTFTWSDGGKYEGEWEDGKFHGQGTFTFSDGNKGVGSFRGNKPWNITIYDKDGKISWKMVKGVRVEK